MKVKTFKSVMSGENSKAGFTAVELIIVIATLAVLAAVLLPKVTSLIAQRKAMRDLVTMNRTVEGLAKFYEDCGTYPTDIEGLIDKTNPTVTLNGSSMATCWHGPYIDQTLIAGSTTDIQGAFGTADHISVLVSAAPVDLNGNGNPGGDYAIQATGIPNDMAEYLERKIDNDNPGDANAPTTGKWVYTCAGGSCTCQLVFREL